MNAPQSTGSAPAPPIGHAHVADLETCLDLINTVEYTDGIPEEHIPDVDAAVSYFASHGVAHADALRAQAAAQPAAWLSRVYRARGALREIWDAAVEGRSVEP